MRLLRFLSLSMVGIHDIVERMCECLHIWDATRTTTVCSVFIVRVDLTHPQSTKKLLYCHEKFSVTMLDTHASMVVGSVSQV